MVKEHIHCPNCGATVPITMIKVVEKGKSHCAFTFNEYARYTCSECEAVYMFDMHPSIGRKRWRKTKG